MYGAFVICGLFSLSSFRFQKEDYGVIYASYGCKLCEKHARKTRIGYGIEHNTCHFPPPNKSSRSSEEGASAGSCIYKQEDRGKIQKSASQRGSENVGNG